MRAALQFSNLSKLQSSTSATSKGLVFGMVLGNSPLFGIFKSCCETKRVKIREYTENTGSVQNHAFTFALVKQGGRSSRRKSLAGEMAGENASFEMEWQG